MDFLRDFSGFLFVVLTVSTMPVSSPLAEVVEDLYEATVPVGTRDTVARQTAIGHALGEVVIKVTGRRDSVGAAEVVEASKEPGRFVQQFQYLQGKPSATNLSGLLLRARFDPFLVEGLVRDSGLLVWGRQRPTLLAWVATDGQGGRQVLSSDGSDDAAAALIEVGRSRGIPVLLPLMDLEDQLLVEASELRAGYSEQVATASERYGAEAVLVARTGAVSASTWEGRFELMLADGGQAWTGQAPTREALLAASVNEAADRMARRYAGLSAMSGSSMVDLWVFGITGVADYARVLAYLESLDQVDELIVMGLDSERLSLRLRALGGGQNLRQVVQIGSVMDLLPTSADGGMLHFRLRP